MEEQSCFTQNLSRVMQEALHGMKTKHGKAVMLARHWQTPYNARGLHIMKVFTHKFLVFNQTYVIIYV